MSDKAAKFIRATIRSWRLGANRNNQSLEEIARFVNPFVRGWVNYYGRYYRSALTPTLRCLERSMVYWVRRKFKRFARHRRQAVHWLGQVARRDPNLFVLWQRDQWIKLRAIIWRQWKRPWTRAKALSRRGLSWQRAWASATNGRGPWWNDGASHMNHAVTTRELRQQGLVSLLQESQRLAHSN